MSSSFSLEMKLNNKGYMLVEVIVSSAIALVMAYFLIDITIKLVNKNNDYYLENVLLADKNLVSKEIMKDINSMKLTNVVVDEDNTVNLIFNNDDSNKKSLKVTNRTITYGDYSKTFSDEVNISLPVISTNNNILTIKISAYTNYSKEDYGIKIVVPYDPNVINVVLPPENSEVEANPPKLVNGLIPVYYNESTNKWVKADSNNTSNSWYDYVQKKWANAVLVTDTNRATYQSASAGTTINDSDILAFYVWIPRYKYKVWNINKVVGTDSYDAYNTGIDIKFENGTETSGTITCNYDFTVTEGNGLSETCTGSNGDYYTHPAFTFGSDELTGFWMCKFEISSSDPSATDGGGNTTSLTTKIIPNVVSWRSNPVSNFWKVIYDMQASSNIYGLPTDRTNIDSHMLTNMEWGAVAYLTNSKYGRCTDGTCTEVELNTNSSRTTGCGPQSQGSTSTGPTCNAYNTTLGMLASTTGNIYGVYDMSGGSLEYVMGNMSNASGSYTYYALYAGTNYTYTGNEKYVTTYSYGTTSTDQQAYNRARLGDATGEVTRSAGSNGAWYSNESVFPYSSRQWFVRGDNCYAWPSTGLFDFDDRDGSRSEGGLTYAVLVGF